ncbi:hypothetical protein [Calothrix sp. PCC 6303]|uniref:hypothetical protein n=1 Tax=Calothrix sp. PCC 6303 TaxID=1170562 RepID=UPI0002E72A50|nr:hypothetical protein [Calothrix sp. PCC 6303]
MSVKDSSGDRNSTAYPSIFPGISRNFRGVQIPLDFFIKSGTKPTPHLVLQIGVGSLPLPKLAYL